MRIIHTILLLTLSVFLNNVQAKPKKPSLPPAKQTRKLDSTTNVELAREIKEDKREYTISLLGGSSQSKASAKYSEHDLCKAEGSEDEPMSQFTPEILLGELVFRTTSLVGNQIPVPGPVNVAAALPESNVFS